MTRLKLLLFKNANIVWFLFGLNLSFIQNKVSSYIPLSFLIIISLILAYLLLVYVVLVKKRIEPNIKAESLPDETAQKKKAHKGLVVFLSLYSHKKKSFTLEQLEKCIKEEDYRTLDIPDTSITNYGHTIKAIKANLHHLEYLWIVTTRCSGDKSKATLDYLPVLKRYLYEELFKGVSVNIKYGPEYSVETSEDSQICKQTSDIIQKIYNESGLREKDIIVDVTGGTASMKVGAVLASLNKDQSVQVIGARYNPVDGKPITGQDAFPIIIGYEPVIKKEF